MGFRYRRQMQVIGCALGSDRRVETGQAQHRMGHRLRPHPNARGEGVVLQGTVQLAAEVARKGDPRQKELAFIGQVPADRSVVRGASEFTGISRPRGGQVREGGSPRYFCDVCMGMAGSASGLAGTVA